MASEVDSPQSHKRNDDKCESHVEDQNSQSTPIRAHCSVPTRHGMSASFVARKFNSSLGDLWRLYVPLCSENRPWSIESPLEDQDQGKKYKELPAVEYHVDSHYIPCSKPIRILRQIVKDLMGVMVCKISAGNQGKVDKDSIE